MGGTFNVFDGQNGVQCILSVKAPVTIDTILNFNGDFEGHGEDDATCKQTFSWNRLI